MEKTKLRTRRCNEEAAKECYQKAKANAITGSEINRLLYLNEFDSGFCTKMVDVRVICFDMLFSPKSLKLHPPGRLFVPCSLKMV